MDQYDFGLEVSSFHGNASQTQRKETEATEIAMKSKKSWQVACLACNFKVKFTYRITWITLK